MHILLLNTCDTVESTSVTVTGSGLRIAVDSAHTAAEEKSRDACRELRANQQKNMKQQRHKHRRGRAGWFWQPRQTLKLHSVQCGCHIWMQQCSSSIFFHFVSQQKQMQVQTAREKWTESQCRVRVNEGKTFIFNFSIKMLLFSAVQRIKRGRTMRRTFSFSLTHNKQTLKSLR